MKKQLTLLAIAATLCLGVGVMGSCSKAAAVVTNKCDTEAKKVTDAASAFSADPTNKAKCQAYANALSDFFKACPTYYTGATKKDLEDFVANACK
jgi:hypothetical protein